MTDQPDHDRTDQLAAALLEVQRAMPTVHKGKTATVQHKQGGGSHSYSYADLADVSAAILPLLVANGLAWSCAPREASRGYELVGTLLHVSGQSLSGGLPLHGNDPQQLGSAITYARRYLLGCLTGIVTDDDTDAAPAQGSSRTRGWDGPSTAELLNQMDADGSRAGVTYAQAVGKMMRNLNLSDVSDLEPLDPWIVAPYAAEVKARAEQVVAEQATASAASSDEQAETNQPADDPWANTP